MSSSQPRASFWFLLLKLGSKFIVPILKSAKFAKFGLAGLSLATYTYMYTWQFALFIMAALFCHEFGHALAMRASGLTVKGIYFIPFLGGAAVSDSAFTTRKQEAFVALAGPAFGLAVSGVCVGAFFLTGNSFWGAAAAWNAAINLFNLLPIFPLDGGRVMRSCAFSIHSKLGFVLLTLSLLTAVGLAIAIQSGLFLLLSIVGGLELADEIWTKRKLKQAKNTPEDTREAIAEATAEESSATADIEEKESGEVVEKELEGMSGWQILASLAMSAGLIALCFWCLHFFQAIPEVKVAQHLFIDRK